MENKCSCCNVDTDQDKLIKCCICKNSYKYSCVGLTINEVKVITTKPGLSFTCTNCTGPIKITIEDEQTVHNVLRRAKQLKDSSFGHISISYDRTPKQIEYYRKVKRELDTQLRQKIFFVSASESEFSFICLIETWLSSDILSCEYFGNNYSVFRGDRKFNAVEMSRGGGVLIAYANNLNVTKLDLTIINNTVPTIDIMGCKAQFTNSFVYLFSLYCYERWASPPLPPSIPADRVV
ncbi:hypothetical protein NQ318_021228 [Aromia moschata]|uniref:Uncharacterized protein n=1 Tax=Aromia moschata TaxID=1265417 RepID=A0AAV8XYQ9_9CUCU|nr:hypothetical protein NQ318_021228 [Aromia moschata]